MSSDAEIGPPDGGSSLASFPTTRWSVILTAREGATEEARAALEELCRDYWHPVYAFIRRIGHDPDEALDITQGYFTRLLEKDFLGSIDPRAGRFRSFILVSARHYVSNHHEHRRAKKRGGGVVPISLDAEQAESQYRVHATDYETPERTFERRWALTVLERALDRLRDRYERNGKTEEFDAMRPLLTSAPERGYYRELSARLGVTEGAVKVAAHRFRTRFGEALRTEVEQLVSSPDDIEAEIRDLLSAL